MFASGSHRVPTGHNRSPLLSSCDCTWAVGRDPKFTSRSDHQLDWIQIVPGSTSWSRLQASNFFVSCRPPVWIVNLLSSVEKLISLTLKIPRGK